MKILFFKYCLIEPLFSWDANVSCFIPYGRGPFIPSKVQVFGSCERFQRNVWEKKRRKTAPHIQSRDSHRPKSFRCVIDIIPVKKRSNDGSCHPKSSFSQWVLKSLLSLESKSLACPLSLCPIKGPPNYHGRWFEEIEIGRAHV